MSKKVKSDGRAQVALEAAVRDNKLNESDIVSFINKKNLNQCNKKYLKKIRCNFVARFPGKNPMGKDGKVLDLIDEYILIREKQSPNRMADYSVLAV